MNIKKIHYESVIVMYFIMYNISTGVSCNSFFNVFLIVYS
jgi:hypothetical protein